MCKNKKNNANTTARYATLIHLDVIARMIEEAASQCRELLRLGKILPFPNTDIANMIINLSDLIFKLAQLVTGQSVAADEYIQQRSISTERVLDPYLLITRAITPPPK